MKRLLSLLFLLIFINGCGTVVSKNETKAEKEIQNKTDAVTDAKAKLAQNTKDKMIHISSLAYGVDYSLDSLSTSNNIPEVETAKKLNDRVISIAGAPHVDEMAKIRSIVDMMNSTIDEERKKGQKLIEDKDSEINAVQKEKNDLKENLEKKVQDLTDTAKKQAEESDKQKIIIDSVNGYFGLGAVFYGLKRFITSCLVGILIFGVIFLLLRILAASNPIAGAVFSIFNFVGSLFIHLIKGLAPKATNLGGLTDKHEVEKYKSVLSKIIDGIEDIQFNKDKTDTVSLRDLLNHFKVEMDEKDKGIITEIKKDLRWKK